ncbi:MAG TPA: hypothetical protein VNS46_00990 [Nocardioides sp.]|nr:hypothetical protein [Nocardioides sp.]
MAGPGDERVAFVWVREPLNPVEYPGLLLDTRQLADGQWQAYVVYRRDNRAVMAWFSPDQVRPHGRG